MRRAERHRVYRSAFRDRLPPFSWVNVCANREDAGRTPRGRREKRARRFESGPLNPPPAARRRFPRLSGENRASGRGEGKVPSRVKIRDGGIVLHPERLSSRGRKRRGPRADGTMPRTLRTPLEQRLFFLPGETIPRQAKPVSGEQLAWKLPAPPTILSLEKPQNGDGEYGTTRKYSALRSARS